MGLVTTSVGKLHVEERGSGPPVFMWPSLFCDGNTLRAQAEELAADHRVLVVDGPGHGRSEPPRARFRLEATARALGEIMDTVGAPRAILVGNAWGGMIMTQLAASEPGRAAALVLLNCPFHEWAGAKRLKLRLAHWLLATLGPRRMARMVLGTMVTPDLQAAQPQRYQELLDSMGAAQRRGFAIAAASAMFDRPPLGPVLATLRVPTLVIAGDRDPLYPVDEVRAEVAQIAGARLEIVPDTCHLSAWESPERVNRLIRSFVTELAVRASS